MHESRSVKPSRPLTAASAGGASPVLGASPRMQRQRQDFARVQASANARGGLPAQLRQGVEALSGMSMAGVRVHYNSPKPAQWRAKAYAQGTDIHLGPGQERHLPHEAWHVVQQAQGRVRPTMQMQGRPVNDDTALEREADRMGARAATLGVTAPPQAASVIARPAGVAQRMSVADERQSLFNDQKGPKPGLFTTWYERMPDNSLVERTRLRWSWSGYTIIRTYQNHGLQVYESCLNSAHSKFTGMEKRLGEVGQQVRDTREDMLRRMRILADAELLLNEKVNQWVKDHVSVQKVLGATLGITVLGVGVIYGLSLVEISKWIYLGTTSLSELVGIWYTVRWVRNELLPGVAKLLLIGLNSASMISAALTVAYHLINSAPINTFIWGALPFGLVLGELIAYLLAKKEAWRQGLVRELEAAEQSGTDLERGDSQRSS